MINGDDTRVAVCCYTGDAGQVVADLPAYLHHDCPLTILSPEDSKVDIVSREGITCRFGGKRAYTGQDSLDRQAEHLRLLLEFPENSFLIHDADSFCLDPLIPQYLYDAQDAVWSNQVYDGIPDHQPYFPEGWPHVAFQPPYFMTRKIIERLLAVKDDPACRASPMMPFIDFYMVQLTITAGLPWARFMDCLSHTVRYPVRDFAGNAVMVHSVKDPRAVQSLIKIRADFRTANPDVSTFISPPVIHA